MKARLVVSVIFLVVFFLNLIFGKGISSGWDWCSGLAFGLAITNLIQYLEKHHG